jgi:hypothetical protein
MTKISIVLIASLTSACVARTGFGIEPIAPPSATFVASTDGSAPPPPPAQGAPVQAAPAPAPQAEAAPAIAEATPAVAKAGGKYAPGEDVHWFQADDYLIATDAKTTKKGGWYQVGKMTEAASGGSKNEAHFLLANGTEVWSGLYVRSRVATKADMKVGATAICFTSWASSNGWVPPDKHGSRTGAADPGWLMATITDTADMYKGRITVGDKSCDMGAVRVVVH